jgi:hypothetical protein
MPLVRNLLSTSPPTGETGIKVALPRAWNRLQEPDTRLNPFTTGVNRLNRLPWVVSGPHPFTGKWLLAGKALLFNLDRC